MSSMAVIGSTGMLGYAVTEYFTDRGYEVRQISRKEFDITKDPFSALEHYILECDIVVNCTGVIKQQVPKHSIADVLKVNAVFPRNLASFCKQMNIKCFQVTTDAVFSGVKGEYTEEDVVDAEDVHGLSKAAGEALNCMTIRTAIIGEERGHYRSLIEWAKSQRGGTVNGYVNHYWNGVTTVHLAEVIEKILDNEIYTEGIFHLFSPNAVSKKELLEVLNEVYELNLTVQPAEAPVFCDRTLSSVYSLSSHLCTKTIMMQLYEMKEFFEMSSTPVLIH